MPVLLQTEGNGNQQEVVVGYLRHHDVVAALLELEEASPVDGTTVLRPRSPFVLEANQGVAKFHPNLNSPASRSEAIAKVLAYWHQTHRFACLRGWRNECFQVHTLQGQLVCQVERAGIGLLGMRRFGCHLNGYVIKSGDHGSLCMWIARRSATKQTYPGMLDNLVGGGLSCHQPDPFQNILKECQEEAGIPAQLAATQVQPVGAISFVQECPERGLVPETEYVFDMELAPEFQPECQDGEVQEFYLWTLDEVRQHLCAGEFTPEAGLVVLDFFLRHGYIRPNANPSSTYLSLVAGLHQDVHSLFGTIS